MAKSTPHVNISVMSPAGDWWHKRRRDSGVDPVGGWIEVRQPDFTRSAITCLIAMQSMGQQFSPGCSKAD